jgi:hypothetical protein
MAQNRDDHAAAVLELPVVVFPESDAVPGPAAVRIAGIVLGRLVAFRAPDWALVALKGRESVPPIRARRLVGMSSADRGREVALMFEAGDPERPVIIGCVEEMPGVETDESKLSVTLDAETIVFTGEKELVLRCGEASITLRKDGRVVVRGAYVETRSSGVNRIKGGSVQIN